MGIKAISYDEKSNTVTISGPFDAEKVCNELCCKAGCVIKEMNIKGKGEGKTEKPDKNNKKPKDATTGDAKPTKDIPKADLGPLLEKMMAAMVGPEPPRGKPVVAPPNPPRDKPVALVRGEPIAPPPAAAQGVDCKSIWPALASSVAGYSYNPSYDPSSYYGGGYGYGKPAAPPGGYYGVPVYDSQGWYYGGGQQQSYYPQQQPCSEDPNAGCSVM
jgi:hypothetical protein